MLNSAADYIEDNADDDDADVDDDDDVHLDPGSVSDHIVTGRGRLRGGVH